MMSFVGAVLVIGGMILTFDEDQVSTGFTYSVTGAALVVADQFIGGDEAEERQGALAPCTDVEPLAPTFNYLMAFEEVQRDAQYEELSQWRRRAQQAHRSAQAGAEPSLEVGDR